MFDGNVKAEWNQNILRNLKNQYPSLSKYDDHKILKEYDDFIMTDTDESFEQWMAESI
jgi:hypothetical protein